MINKRQFLSHISEGSFRELFVSELGWNRFRGQAQLPAITVDEVDYCFTTIAERNGFQILTCSVDAIPTNSICKKIDTKLRRQANDYIAIYQLGSTEHHLWVVPVKANEKRDLVLVEYETAEKADLLYSKIDGFSFNLGEDTTIVDLRSKVQGAFAVNSEKITKDFYAGFKKEHKAFAEFISGIDDQIPSKDNRNKQWYTSVMLNRLMFCYFIQKKGFLDFDFDYLRHKLNWVRQQQGEDKFFGSFYKGFLVHLFEGGLNSPSHARDFESVYGKIPYLNGGMFDKHQIELDYENIDIADDAFIRLFDFFDTWRWHLDTRITASGKDINPDVLGYIFEQYINDRAQMGAYYTKEDITEYIGRNCILPFLFDKVREKNADAFKPNGFVWSTLQGSGDRYIFDAVKRGSDRFDEIPEDVSRGIITEAMRHEYRETPVGELPADHIPLATLRSEWNKPTPEPWALPTEIWRETIERLQRCQSIKAKIAAGEITSINDFITYNLDIRLFASDLLATADRLFIKHFYEALQSVTILDPTCGSGAFLFAAMNILEPLYEACIERMQDQPDYFKTQLAEISDKYRSNIQYFIFKSIILRNLYGVDIMVEATEIAKLRLFLKMVAVVDVDRRLPNLGLDPLPDIDFNIRCGNSLVGYANEEQLLETLRVNKENSLFFEDEIAQFRQKIEDELNTISKTYNTFKCLQLEQEINQIEFKKAKAELQKRLTILNALLNEQLFDSGHQGIPGNREQIYKKWLRSHQPFHWIAEFYQIIHDKGGFDVVIGNPPYVVYNKKDKITKKSVSEIYKINGYETALCNNLYAFVIERSILLCNSLEKVGMIIPISAFSNSNMLQLQDFLKKQGGDLYISTFHQRPAQLFVGVLQRLCIFICTKGRNIESKIYTTEIHRWYSHTREFLFSNLSYINDSQYLIGSFVKIGTKIETSIKRKYYANNAISKYLSNTSNDNTLYYRSAGGGYWISILNRPFDSYTTSNRQASFATKYISLVFSAFMNSNLFWWYYSTNFDLFNFTEGWMFGGRLTYPESHIIDTLSKLSNYMENSLRNNAYHYTINSKTNGLQETVTYRKYLSKSLMDEIDKVLAVHYGFTDEELDFIINYDIKYRMGDELNSEE